MVLSQPDSDDIPTAEASSSVITRETSPLKKKFNQVIEGFKQIEDAPQTNRVDQKINFSQLDHPCSRTSSSTPEMREMSPTIIENSIRNPLQRAQDTLSQFLPQLPGTYISLLIFFLKTLFYVKLNFIFKVSRNQHQ